MPYVDNNGTRIHYHVERTGPASGAPTRIYEQYQELVCQRLRGASKERLSTHSS